jgi:hypothetical protein
VTLNTSAWHSLARRTRSRGVTVDACAYAWASKYEFHIAATDRESHRCPSMPLSFQIVSNVGALLSTRVHEASRTIYSAGKQEQASKPNATRRHRLPHIRKQSTASTQPPHVS